MKNEMVLEDFGTVVLNQEEMVFIEGGRKDRHWDGTITFFGATVYDGNEPKGERWFWQ